MGIVSCFQAAKARTNLNKMNPLLTNQKVLIWLCAHSTEGVSSKPRHFYYVAFTIFVFVAYICFLAPSIAYLMKFISDDLNEALYVLIQILAIVPMINTLIIMICLRKKFIALFKQLKAIYDACKWNFLNFYLKMSALSEFLSNQMKMTTRFNF